MDAGSLQKAQMNEFLFHLAIWTTGAGYGGSVHFLFLQQAISPSFPGICTNCVLYRERPPPALLMADSFSSFGSQVKCPLHQWEFCSSS